MSSRPTKNPVSAHPHAAEILRLRFFVLRVLIEAVRKTYRFVLGLEVVIAQIWHRVTTQRHRADQDQRVDSVPCYKGVLPYHERKEKWKARATPAISSENFGRLSVTHFVEAKLSMNVSGSSEQRNGPCPGSDCLKRSCFAFWTLTGENVSSGG